MGDIKLFVRSFDELSLPDSIIKHYVLDAILLQKTKYLFRIPCLKQLQIKSVAPTRVVTGGPCIIRPTIEDATASHQDRMINEAIREKDVPRCSVLVKPVDQRIVP